MNITNEGHNMPKKPKAASKAKPNEVYTDAEKKPASWDDVFNDVMTDALNSHTVDAFLDRLVSEYHPPKKKSAY